MSGVRVSPGMLRDLEAVLRQAGAEGLSMAEVREQLGKSRAAVYATAAAARKAGTCIVEQQHPIAFYFHPSVPEPVRRATFERRATHERQKRKAATTAGFAKHVAERSAAAPSHTRAPASRSRRPVPAVDPNALRRDAVETWPDGLEKIICPGYRSLPERMAAECKPERLPEEPPSAWVRAVLAARKHPEAA